MVHALEFAPLHCFFTRSNIAVKLDASGRSFRRVNVTRHVNCRTADTPADDCLTTNRRRSPTYQPSSWNLDFLDSMPNHQPGEVQKETTKLLEEEVRCMLDGENLEPVELLQLVDDIDRLGLGYKFRESVKKALDKMISGGEATKRVIKTSLHASALYFRLLRQNGYVVSTDIFESFKDQGGNFKADLALDVKGMLSMYEASHLAFEGESVLDEAKAFTSFNLKNLQRNIHDDAIIKEQVNHALELPFHHRMQRLEARWNIEAHTKMSGVNRPLLALAKLDYNDVQSVFQIDLRDMIRWWRDVDLVTKLSFARDRLMESYFWAVGMVFEPQSSNVRKGLAKVANLITVLDDVYDVYGSLDELDQFTQAVDRWDINAVKHLPDYMKICFLALYNTVNELAYDSLKEKGVVVIPYLSKAWADLFKAFLQEACWRYNKCTPSFNEYLNNAWLSSSGALLLVHAYFLVTENISEEAIKCLENYHALLRRPSTVFRLLNDLGSSKAEIERGETINAISCYMHETGHSEETAREHMKKLIDYSWQKMNEELASSSHFEACFKEVAMNLARIAQCQYQHGDAHSAPDVTARNRVSSVLFHPIRLTEGDDVASEREDKLFSDDYVK